MVRLWNSQFLVSMYKKAAEERPFSYVRIAVGRINSRRECAAQHGMRRAYQSPECD